MAIVKRKISELPEASAIDGTELVEVVQNGQNRRATTGQLGGGGGGGIPEAPADGKTYGRKDEGWAEITSSSTQSVTPITASRSISVNDAGSYLLADNPADIILTVPDDASLNMPVGADIAIEQHNDGQVELAPASGVAVNVAAGFGLKTSGKYAVVSLKKVAANTWTLFGNLEVLP